ncbi:MULTISPECIES: amidohydrolase [Brucella]|jgi:predicted amidohydrolase YtcJ|uniref:Amidohydrolase n=1 Tax=Brucella lupini TaxID=255457 RepID=A0A256GVB8_9HYPH|nr:MULTISPECIES: amidohydrolase [Brucella/Ochrobactrum group]RNL47960.1 amidohydrolase [Ochrobactrum sp. MH181795]KAB2704585.1 amidohydrolase [Brucella lupini]KAB2724587.1 amidohydrolase [Brucella anthropi]KAB2738939.1 amidohydrolase [Brucella anthropi]KAB2797845.1 amidohydrolase [Brucella anthropi]
MCIACNPGMVAFLRSTASRRDFLKYLGAAAATSAFACSSPGMAFAQQAAAPAGDIIFKGGTILTMNDKAPRAEAIAIRGNKILAVGKLDDVQSAIGSGAQVVDLQGRTLMPGLIDPHMHFVFTAFEDWIDVSPITTPDYATVWSKLQKGVADAKPGEWVRAQQFDASITRDAKIPTIAELDALAPNNPFFMQESNGHIAYANSAAFKAAGITRETPDPSGARFVKDADGSLTGRLEEMAAQQEFLGVMPSPTAADMIGRVQRFLDHASSVGCTMLHDCGIGIMAGAQDLKILDAVLGGGKAPVRYRGMLVSTIMDEWEKEGIKPGRGNDLFRVDGIKAWADGSNQAQTGYQRENYLGTDARGALNYSLEQVTEVIRRAHEGGWQVGVHANGDAAIDMVLDAYEAVLGKSSNSDLRHRIEHCSVFHPEQMVRMKDMGLSPSFLIGHVRWWGKAFRDRLLGPERARFYDPCASALAAGLKISLHSDWNVTPIEPLRYVEDAVTRVMNEGGDVFFPEERIPVDAALRAVTIDAAWQCHMEDQIGSLETGKFADFAILEEDPTAPDVKIGKIKVSETWMDGTKRYAA